MSEKEKAVGGDQTAHAEVVATSSGFAQYTMNNQGQNNLQPLKTGDVLLKVLDTQGVQLKRFGQGLRAKCPIHNGDNETSFEVYQDTGRFYCHSCGAGGNTIELAAQLKGLDFKDAVAWLAGIAGISLETLGFFEGNSEEAQQYKKQIDLYATATNFYVEQLWSPEGEAARKYLNARGFSDEHLRLAGWGYSKGDIALHQALKKSGADLELARETGLLRKNGWDFTANAKGRAASPDGYIVIPHSYAGKVDYFSARAIAAVNPKDKSRNLPGRRQVYWAEARKSDRVILVEGQMDAESIRIWGNNGLALCGVGEIPEDSLLRLGKKAKVIYLALDNDLLDANLSPKRKAEIERKAQQICHKLAEQLGPLLMILPALPFKDFNAGLQDGFTAEQFNALLEKASPWIDLLLAEAESALPHDQLALQDETIGQYRRLPSGLQPRYRKRIAAVFQIGLREFDTLLDMDADLPSYSEIKNGVLRFQGQSLGNFQAKISHERTIDDGVNPPATQYRVVGQLANGEKLPIVDIDAKEFQGLNWVAPAWGMRPILYLPPKQSYLLARAIQEVSQASVVRERLHTYTGWVIAQGKRQFLSASGAIGAHGVNPDVKVDLGDNHLGKYELPAPPTDPRFIQNAITTTLDFLHVGARSVTGILWAAMYAAPFTDIAPLNAVLWVYGPTQSGKSTITMLALSHYGKDFIQKRDYHAPVDWTSTATALEGAMFTIKDAPLVIDDFAPQFASSGDAHEIHRKAAYIVRSVGNRSSRARARADLSQQRTRIPRGLAIATAENPIVGQSTVGRIIYVNVAPGDVLPESAEKPLSVLQEKAQNGYLAQAMALFIQALAGNWEKYAAEFLASANAQSEWFRATYDVQSRLPDYFGVLDAGQTLALKVFQKIGGLI